MITQCFTVSLSLIRNQTVSLHPQVNVYTEEALLSITLLWEFAGGHSCSGKHTDYSGGPFK